MAINHIDVPTIKQDFPIFEKKVHGKQLVYLDNAATSQKPLPVIEAISNYYTNHNANIHRGVHQLSDESTQVWESSRQVIAHFFGAKPSELVVTRNTTEALNGVAYGWADHNLHEDDVIVGTLLEHHSNLVTWQQVGRRTGARVAVVDVDEAGRLDLQKFEQVLREESVKLVVLPYVSNALGTILPIEKIVSLVRQHSNARIAVDAAQAAPHMRINFSQLGVDFLAFSGHKMLGPMGVGGLFVRQDLLEDGSMQPWLFGGGMIDQVSQQQASFHPVLAERFTAGTPDVASLVGLAAACEYLTDTLGMSNVEAHDRMLVSEAIEQLSELDFVDLVGPLPAEGEELDRLGSVAFTVKDVHAHDVAQVLDAQGVAVRSGHHCTMPLHTQFGWPATVRASFQVYNDTDDIEVLVSALEKVPETFAL